MKKYAAHADSRLDLSVYDHSFLEKIRELRRVETGCATHEAYEALLVRDPAEAETFQAMLRIGFSEFFRNPLTFAVLDRIVFPLLRKKMCRRRRNELRVWSAGCAGGQEPYSCAMLCEEFAEHEEDTVNYRIFATDACEKQLVAARSGVFTENSIGNMSVKRFERWCVREGSGFRIASRLARQIEFSVYDLLDAATEYPSSSIFGGFDLVLCCNLLFYYTPEIRKSILEKLARSLDPDAFLVAGETERQIIMENGFFEIFPESAIFQKFHSSPRSSPDD